METSPADRDRPSRAIQYSDSNARKRAYDSTTNHLTPEPTPARRHEGTADQMSCQFASLEHDKRGAETADGFAIFVATLTTPPYSSVDELTGRAGLSTYSKLSWRLFFLHSVCAAS
jgi:hypothetical protein